MNYSLNLSKDAVFCETSGHVGPLHRYVEEVRVAVENCQRCYRPNSRPNR